VLAEAALAEHDLGVARRYAALAYANADAILVVSPGSVDAAQARANVEVVLGRIALARGRVRAAEGPLRSAVRAQDRAYAAQPRSIFVAGDEADARLELGRALARAGRRVEARAELQAAVDVLEPFAARQRLPARRARQLERARRELAALH